MSQCTKGSLLLNGNQRPQRAHYPIRLRACSLYYTCRSSVSFIIMYALIVVFVGGKARRSTVVSLWAIWTLSVHNDCMSHHITIKKKVFGPRSLGCAPRADEPQNYPGANASLPLCWTMGHHISTLDLLPGYQRLGQGEREGPTAPSHEGSPMMTMDLR